MKVTKIFALIIAFVIILSPTNILLAVENPSELWSFGLNTDGQTGLGVTDDNTLTPKKVGSAENWVAISTGIFHSIAIKSDGTLWSFGSNSNGQTGLGTTAGNTLVPTQVGTDNDWTVVSAGYVQSFAIKSDGTLWSFGSNNFGVTGLNTADGDTLTPTQVGTDANWSSVETGDFHTIALKSDGTLWSFGLNNAGRTGLNTDTGNTLAPTQVGSDSDWSVITAGDAHSAAIKSDGTLWTFGSNNSARTGLNTTIGDTLVPTQVGTDTNWTLVSAGTGYVVALKSNNTLWSFGSNDRGRTGQGVTAGNTLVPTQIGTDTNWSKISAGSIHSLLVKSNGSLWSFGSNEYASTGVGTISDNTVSPAQISSVDAQDWVIASAGGTHSIALREIGILPTIITSAATNVTSESATFNGEITNLGDRVTTSWGFNYGLTEEYGEIVGVGGGLLEIGSFYYDVSDLSCVENYFVQSFVTTNAGTSTGNVITFSTCPNNDSESEVQESGSGSKKGTSVTQRVKNLIRLGNIELANQLMSEYSSLFSNNENTKTTENILTPEIFTNANMMERDLEITMSGSDVRALQQLLNKLGFVIAENGAGSPGSETEYFGTLTKNALSKYQVANNILPSAGYFGPITRAQMKNVGVEGLWW